MKPFVYDITGINIINAFASLKHLPYSILLDSADRNHPNSRYSFIASMPIETIEAKNNKITVTNWEQKLSLTGNPFEILQERMKSWIPFSSRHPNMPPFQGGAAGLFGYDLGRYLETLPQHAKSITTAPDMAIGIYDQVVAHDHLLKKTYIFTHARNETEAVRKRDHLIDTINQGIDIPEFHPQTMNWKSNLIKDEYIEKIDQTIRYIYEGDIFQANIAQRFDADLPENFEPFIHYLNMRDINPAPFATYMNVGNVKISSASPERFIVIKDKNVETCPIKGTKPRSDKIMQDRANKSDLQNSEKDKAENTMIVDLLRNDLSRVCTPDSVRVTDLCKVETFASLHHLVSTIKAKLPHNKSAIDLLGACFPGGSITGAPKIRAMEIIDEIEPTKRGAYCGSIGYIGFDGNMDTNILIRTLTYENNRVTLQVGGGIVSDSNPEDEYQETLDKAKAVFQSFKQSKQENNNNTRLKHRHGS